MAIDPRRLGTCFFKCDPAKNKRCSKQHCYLYGGKCRLTMDLSAAASPEIYTEGRKKK